jgi:hypothetical protein
MTLQRLILTFKPEDVEIRTLYRSKDGPDPNTKGRTREVTEFTRVGLQQALEVLEDDAECVGTSGYEIREDTISVDVAQKKGA